jgi:acyl-CoA synthetase (AMP-forming)/AMP-acid ligase II
MIQRSMAGASCGGATMPDTWRATGDRACIGPKGEIQILGRVDDLIQRAGTDIEIPVIEDTLAECEGVAKAAAIGVPDDTLGDALWVFVERRRGGNLTGASLRRHLRTHFPNLAVDTVVITDAVPATRTGEPRKFVLRKWAAGRLSEGDGRHQGDFVGVRVAQA